MEHLNSSVLKKSTRIKKQSVNHERTDLVSYELAEVTSPSTKSNLLSKFQLLATAARDPKLTASALGVLSAVLERYNDREGCARPGAGRLAKDTGRTRKTCQVAAELLITLGYLNVARGNRRANRYTPNFQRGVNLLAKSSVTLDSTLALEATPQVALSPTPEPIKGIHLRNPLMGEMLRGASDTAAGASYPAPHPELKDEWERLLHRGGLPLDWESLRRDCDYRYLRPGLPLAALKKALEQLFNNPHWQRLPFAPPINTRLKVGNTNSQRLMSFDQIDYAKVPT